MHLLFQRSCQKRPTKRLLLTLERGRLLNPLWGRTPVFNLHQQKLTQVTGMLLNLPLGMLKVLNLNKQKLQTTRSLLTLINPLYGRRSLLLEAPSTPDLWLITKAKAGTSRRREEMKQALIAIADFCKTLYL